MEIQPSRSLCLNQIHCHFLLNQLLPFNYCYSFDVECTLKTHVLNCFLLGWLDDRQYNLGEVGVLRSCRCPLEETCGDLSPSCFL